MKMEKAKENEKKKKIMRLQKIKKKEIINM